MTDALSIESSGRIIVLQGDTGEFTAQLRMKCMPDEAIELVTLSLKSDAPAKLPPLTLEWDEPMLNIHHKWNPPCFQNRALDISAGAMVRFTSRSSNQAPVYSFYDIGGTNTMTLALSDALHESEMSALTGSRSGILQCKVSVLRENLPPADSYEVTLRIDRRRIPCHVCIRDVAAWWAAMEMYTPSPVPDAAKLPLYSTWYSFFQKIDAERIEAQCRLARELGMDGVIVDDGWMMEDNSKGYAYCGDWEVYAGKFPDFKAHVDAVHAVGMTYILWFSVPFVGIHSRAWERFKDKVMPAKPDAKWFSLDPRYEEVREYLIGTYERFVRDYGIDGFKLDFIGSFGTPAESDDEAGDARDIASLPAAVDRLMSDVMARLRALNPDIMIEFRQPYIGPVMRKYGNMFRAVDCPNSFADNRVRTLDIRLLCGDTAAHADMFMWHPDEPVESAAMQLVHTLFSVPQVSVLLDTIPQDHVDMIRQCLRFWREHRDVLMDGELTPIDLHLLYPAVMARTDTKLLIAAYSARCIAIEDEPPTQLILVNGTYDAGVVLELTKGLPERTITVTSCTGDVVKQGRLALSPGIHRIDIPPAGSAVLE